MQFLYKIQPVRPELLTTGPTEDEKKIISQHFSYLKALMNKEIVILAGRTLNTDASSFGIVIFNQNQPKRQIKSYMKTLRSRITFSRAKYSLIESHCSMRET